MVLFRGHELSPAVLLVALLLAAVCRGVGSEEPPRVARARAERGDEVKRLCAQAGVAFPPGEVFLRAFKKEGTLECWARNGSTPFQLVKTFAITQASGGPGPKRREGDGQVPEGCYLVDRFNPESLFHLSLGLNYPNASDRILSDPVAPGYDIFLHGGAASVGCVPIGDAEVELLYLLVQASAHQPVAVHLFPARMQGAEWSTWAAQFPEWAEFWHDLQAVYSAFEANRFVPKIVIDSHGRYQVRED